MIWYRFWYKGYDAIYSVHVWYNNMRTAALNFFYLWNFEMSQNIAKLLAMLEADLYYILYDYL